MKVLKTGAALRFLSAWVANNSAMLSDSTATSEENTAVVSIAL